MIISKSKQTIINILYICEIDQIYSIIFICYAIYASICIFAPPIFFLLSMHNTSSYENQIQLSNIVQTIKFKDTTTYIDLQRTSIR